MDIENSVSKNADISDLLNSKCDKYDYLIAVVCGSISGLVDAFFVGSPKNSVLGTWTDTQVDKCVLSFAKMCGWSPKLGKEKNISSAIGFLEKQFPVNYDQRHSGDVNGAFKMSASNHHMKSLAHSPSPIGLFFSILNQFTSTATFVSNGQLITIKTDTQELIGGNFIAKLFCGIVNWIGHLMSDIAGSSGSRGQLSNGRGSGIVIPFYELFGLCNFGNFNVNNNRMNLAQLATRAFENGYDARFGLTMSIPVVICEISIKFMWSIRRFFQYRLPIQKCIPTQKYADLRVMLLCGHATLCLIDGIDAIVRSGGNPLVGFMHLNLIGWFKLTTLVIKELCIKLGISLSIQNQLESLKSINIALQEYLVQLEKIDIEAFRKETAEYNRMITLLNNATNENELNTQLHIALDNMNIKLPWNGYQNFNSFMNDKKSVLRFE